MSNQKSGNDDNCQLSLFEYPLTPDEKMERDAKVEKKFLERVVGAYKALFYPCEKMFSNGMFYLDMVQEWRPDFIQKAVDYLVENRNSLLNERLWQCSCVKPEDQEPAKDFKSTERGRFRKLPERIAFANEAINSSGERGRAYGQTFLDRIRQVVPEALSPE